MRIVNSFLLSLLGVYLVTPSKRVAGNHKTKPQPLIRPVVQITNTSPHQDYLYDHRGRRREK